MIARHLGDAAVLIRMRTSRIYELNATAARIWDLMKEQGSRSAVVDVLLAEFDVDRPEAERAVDELLAALREEGLT